MIWQRLKEVEKAGRLHLARERKALHRSHLISTIRKIENIVNDE